MTNYFTRKGNRIIKFAYVEAIGEWLENAKLHTLYINEGFENDKQMIHFTYNGTKLKVLAVKLPSELNDKLNLIVEHKGLSFNIWIPISKIKIQTLRRIANEVYDWLRDAEDEEWDEYEGKLISENLDTYM